MPYNGSGTYAPPASTFNPAVTNTAINSTDWIALLADVTTALSTCVLKDGQQTPTANIPMGGFKFTGLGAGAASGNSIRYEQVNGVVTAAGDLLRASAAGTFARVPFGTLGDLLVGGGAGAASALTVGANGTIPMARSANTTYGMAYVAALNSAIYGYTYANAAGDVINDIDIAAGGAMDSTGAYWITGAAITKQLDAAWAVGTNAGGLDTGAIGNSDYYIWRIARSDTGVVDALYSLSSTAPTMPANYDFKRLIGWFKRVGGAIVLFHTYEIEGGAIEQNWDVPTLDVNLANTLTTARRTDAVKVPLGFSTIAHINVGITDAAAVAFAWICCPDQTDAAPSQTAAPLANIGPQGIGNEVLQQMYVRTSAAGLIAARANIATVDLYVVSTMGFKWARR